MTVSRITEYNNEMYRQMSINNLDKRHEAQRVDCLLYTLTLPTNREV